ncbi:MAG: hypothetical protein DRI01_03360 [Chloroflexi bacterium]|nr:MAG: hypothetical protein DRI01_03360 [Chloroflexota bacterium]
MGKRGHLSKLSLEHIVFLLLATVSWVVYNLGYFEYFPLSISAVLGAWLFIIFHKTFASNELTLKIIQPSESKQRTLHLILSILFFLFYGLSLLALLQGFYTKTALYYISIALCAGLIAIDILYVNTKTQGNLNLLKSFLLVLNITLTNQILFPYGIGLPDSNYHIFDIVIPIINTGHVPLGYSYSSFPGHHILVAANSLISGVDPRILYYCLGGFVMSLGLLFVFLVGRRFVSLRFGLLAALIYTGCDYLLHWASHPTHMTYTYFLAIAIFAITLYIYHKRDPAFVIFFIILATTMIFTNHFSGAVILIMLTAMLLVELLNYTKDRSHRFQVHGLAMFFFIVLFAHWMYISAIMGTFTGVIKAYYEAFTQEAITSITLTTTFSGLPLGNLLLNEVGSSILIMLSTIGFLHFLKHSSVFKKFVIALVFVFLCLIVVEILMKESYLESHRLFAFLQQFSLVFLAGGAITWILDNSKKWKPLPIILIICLSFFSLASLIHGEETSLFKGDRAYWKLYETPYERYTAVWAKQYVSEDSSIIQSLSFRSPTIDISAEKLPVREVENSQGKEIMVIDFQELPESSFIVFSQFDIDIGFPYRRLESGKYYTGGTSYNRLDESVIGALEKEPKLYVNGMVSIYKSG